MLSNYLKNTMKYLYYKRRYSGSKIAFGSHITSKSSLGCNVEIDSSCHIEESVIGENTRIGCGSCIYNSTIGNDSIISSNAKVDDAKLEHKTLLLKNSFLINFCMNSFSYIAENGYAMNTEVGKFCSIGSELICSPIEHPTTYLSTSPAFYSDKKKYDFSFLDIEHYNPDRKTTIGNDVWIGARVFIKGGIKIGDGAIIAAGSVVVKDVPDYAIVGGVPAKLIRFRFSEEVVMGKVNSPYKKPF